MTVYQKLPALLLPWFAENKRDLPWRWDKEPYHVWLSEIMLQQTRVETVRDYYIRFLSFFPTLQSLADAPLDVVLKYWEGLGYYTRARNLHKAAKRIMQDFGGIFPTHYDDICSLPGIGAYTAGAIASICFDAPTPAVDGNVLRVTARLTASDLPIDVPKVKKNVAQSLASIYKDGNCGDITQSIMELGAMVCLPKSPRCPSCPLSSICKAHKAGIAEKLPVRLPKKARRIEEKTVFFFQAGDKIAIRKRPRGGLLASLWELPNTDGILSATEAVKKAEAWELTPDAPRRAVERIHIFTHVEWHMTCYYIPCSSLSPDFTWVSKSQLSEEIALPSAFRIFLE